jgi:ribose-phosphate pyrophosphokinase
MSTTPTAWTQLLAFEDEREQGSLLAGQLGVPLGLIQRHCFPDGELQLTLPTPLSGAVVLLRGLHQPNQKLVELLIAAPAARELGATQVWLVAPYLAYMRQDMAFHPGEAVSQRHIGAALAGLFDGVVTVDPHLHRIAHLDEALPGRCGVSVSAARLLGAWVASQVEQPLLLGPDDESSQWVREAAQAPCAAGQPALDHAWCQKERLGDHHVVVQLPPGLALAGRSVVLIDDMASTGRTLVEATRLCLAAGATSVDVAVTHALFVGDAMTQLRAAGVRQVWSTDCVPHESNAVSVAPLLAEGLRAGPAPSESTGHPPLQSARLPRVPAPGCAVAK